MTPEVGTRVRVFLRWDKWPYGKQFTGVVEKVDAVGDCEVRLDQDYPLAGGRDLIIVPAEDLKPL